MDQLHRMLSEYKSQIIFLCHAYSVAAIATLVCVSATEVLCQILIAQILQWLVMPKNRIFLGLHFVIAKCKSLQILRNESHLDIVGSSICKLPFSDVGNMSEAMFIV